MEKEKAKIEEEKFIIISDKILLKCMKNICNYYKKNYNIIERYIKKHK